MTSSKPIKILGTLLRIFGGGLLIFGMILQLGIFSVPSLQKYFSLIMAAGLLIYVVGLLFVKSENSLEKKD